jgi:hypothetical protein
MEGSVTEYYVEFIVVCCVATMNSRQLCVLREV